MTTWSGKSITSTMRHLKKLHNLHVIPFVFFLIAVSGFSSFTHAMQRIPAVIHLDTNIGGGVLSPEEMVQKVKEAGLRAAIITDKDNMRVEYGIMPLRNLVKRVKERNSIATYGADNYLNRINAISKDSPDMTVIAGVEALPFYYWEGSYFEDNLRLINLHKHLLIIGMEEGEDFEHIPSVSYNNPSVFDLRCVLNVWPLILLLAGLWLALYKKSELVRLRMISIRRQSRPFIIIGTVIFVAGILFTINNMPFCSRLYDQYHGDRGALPYQNLIDYAESRGGMVFWAHPDAEGSHKLDGIEIVTPGYSDELLSTFNYTGFAVFAAGMKYSGKPGGIWDTVLNQYINGQRQKPVWAIGELDYKEGSWMGETQTVFIVEKNDKSSILKAMREGRMYAVHGNHKPVIEEFQVWDDSLGAWVEMGGAATVFTAPKLKIKVRSAEKDKRIAMLRIIREGVVIKEISLDGNINMEVSDEYFSHGAETYYRIDIKNRLISNPIFVKMENKKQ